MPPNELYLALQRGVIDGYMLIWDIIYGLKLFKVAPYNVDTGFSNNAEVVTMNLKKWNAFTPADQEIFNKLLWRGDFIIISKFTKSNEYGEDPY